MQDSQKLCPSIDINLCNSFLSMQNNFIHLILHCSILQIKPHVNELNSLSQQPTLNPSNLSRRRTYNDVVWLSSHANIIHWSSPGRDSSTQVSETCSIIRVITLSMISIRSPVDPGNGMLKKLKSEIYM